MKFASRLVACLVAVLVLSMTITTASAQTDKYYIFSDIPDDGWVVQGGSVLTTFPHVTDDLAIAVAGDIRALHFFSTGNGSQYDLNGNIINATVYAPIPGFGGQALDGTTDGVNYNYVGEFAGSTSRVWQTDRNWANGAPLFTVRDSIIGITYDPSGAGSLWITYDFSGLAENRALDGNVLSSFSAGDGRWGSLAYEYSTDTLWMINNLGTNEMRQYSKSGTLLLSQTVTNFGNVWGGEFDVPIPEPTALALAAVGLLGIARRRRT